MKREALAILLAIVVTQASSAAEVSNNTQGGSVTKSKIDIYNPIKWGEGVSLKSFGKINNFIVARIPTIDDLGSSDYAERYHFFSKTSEASYADVAVDKTAVNLDSSSGWYLPVAMSSESFLTAIYSGDCMVKGVIILQEGAKNGDINIIQTRSEFPSPDKTVKSKTIMDKFIMKLRQKDPERYVLKYAGSQSLENYYCLPADIYDAVVDVMNGSQTITPSR